MKIALAVGVVCLAIEVAVGSPGALVWQWGTQGQTAGVSMAAPGGVASDASGNVVAVGSFTTGVNFGGGVLSAQGGSSDLWLTRFSASGVRLWSVRDGASFNETAYGVALTGTGVPVVVGGFGTSTTLGGHSLTSHGGEDAFIAAYPLAQADGDATTTWARRIGGTGTDRAVAVAVDASGSILVAGFFSGTVSFGSPDFTGSCGSLTSAGGLDVFLAKLTSDGSGCTWVKQIGGSSSDSPAAVKVDTSGNVYVTGQFQGTASVTGGSSLTSQGGNDIFLVKYSSSGGLVWEHSYGETGTSADDRPTALAVDGNGNVALTGWLPGTTGFGNGKTVSNASGSGQDIFLVKLDPTGTALWAKRYGSSSNFGNEYSAGVVFDGLGNIGLTGQLFSLDDFGCGTLSGNGAKYVFVAELDGGGNCKYSGSYGSTGTNSGVAVVFQPWGTLVTAGYFKSSMDFGRGALTSGAAQDAFVVAFRPVLPSVQSLRRSSSGGSPVLTWYVSDSTTYTDFRRRNPGVGTSWLTWTFRASTTTYCGGLVNRFDGQYHVCQWHPGSGDKDFLYAAQFSDTTTWVDEDWAWCLSTSPDGCPTGVFPSVP